MNAYEAISKIRFMLDVGGSDGFTSADKEALNMAINALSAEISEQPKTNADRIRQMTDEELANFINDVTDCCSDGYICEKCPLNSVGKQCNIVTFEKWLKQEVS